MCVQTGLLHDTALGVGTHTRLPPEEQSYLGTFLQRWHVTNRHLGFRVIYEDEHFFEIDAGDYVVSNPLFSIHTDLPRRLAHLQKSFVLIMPCSVLTTLYFQKLDLIWCVYVIKFPLMTSP